MGQDVLITTDGDVMTVYIDDIGSSTIYYKTTNSENSSLQRIDKSKIYMIKKADGTKIDLSSLSTPITQTTTPATAQPLSPTFTPKIIFSDFSSYFQGGSEQIRTHNQQVSD